MNSAFAFNCGMVYFVRHRKPKQSFYGEGSEQDATVTAFIQYAYRHNVEKVENVTDRLPIHSKTALFENDRFENGTLTGTF